MTYLRQATASQSRSIGPFHDDTDFKTPETGLTINASDIKLIVNGAAAVNKNSGGGTHRANGFYGITFDATDTATVGELEVSVAVAGAAPVFKTFYVVEEAVFDALYAASAPGFATVAGLSALDVKIDALDDKVDEVMLSLPTLDDIAGVTSKLDEMLEDDGGTARFTANALEEAPSGGGTDWTADEKTAIKTILGVPASGTTPDAPTAGALKVIDDFLDTEIADIQSRLPAALVSGRMDASVGAMAANVMTAAAAAADLTTELQSGLATAASLSTVAGYLDTEVAAILAAVDTEVAAIKAVTDLLPDAGALTSLATAAALATVDTVVDGIKATTDKLDDTVEDDAGTYRFTTNALEQAPSGGGGGGTDWTADERTAIRTILGIPGSGTTPADPSDGILDDIRDLVTALPVPLTAAGVRSAVGLASANLDTQLDAIPTAAENATAVWGAGARTLTALDEDSTTLDLDATIRGAVGLASANLDTQLDALPTAAEVWSSGTRTLTSGGGASAEDIAAAVWDEPIADHLDAGSTGNSLNGATAAGNPWEAIIEGSLTAEDILRVLAAVAAGKTTIVAGGGGTATVTFRDITDSSDIVEAEMDGSERQSVAVTP